MTQEPTVNLESMPTAPPTTQGPLGVRRSRKTWPEWLGIILIVIGLIGFVWCCFTLFLTNWTYAVAGTTGSSTTGLMKEYRTLTIAYTIAYAISGLYLSFAGTLVITRRQSCRKHVLIWSITRLAIGAVGAFVVLIQNPLFRNVTQTSTASSGPVNITLWNNNATLLNLSLQMGLMLLWVVLGPVVCMILFTRKPIIAEIATWKRK